jgi:protein-S-isoprenylcysteine O-methyltransferase Ste14
VLATIALAELVVVWIFWVLVFVAGRTRHPSGKTVVTAPAARKGIFLQVVAFSLACSFIPAVGFRVKPPAFLIALMILGPASVAAALVAVRHLGKQWRLDAALTEDHELIETGPYRWVRHPIYASMLGMLLATGLAWTWWPILLAALALFLAGTEIRVRAEDALLQARFQELFTTYRSRVPAYLPFLR